MKISGIVNCEGLKLALGSASSRLVEGWTCQGCHVVSHFSPVKTPIFAHGQ